MAIQLKLKGKKPSHPTLDDSLALDVALAGALPGMTTDTGTREVIDVSRQDSLLDAVDAVIRSHEVGKKHSK